MVKACPSCGSREDLATQEKLSGHAHCDVSNAGEVVHKGWTDILWDESETEHTATDWPVLICLGCYTDLMLADGNLKEYQP